MFKKWPKIHNHYQQKTIDIFLDEFPELRDETFVVTEKLHGANVQIYFEAGEPWRVGSRTRFLERSDKFYNVWLVLEKYNPLLNMFQAHAEEGHTYRLFGELFGGKVQKGVDYGPKQRLAFFGLMVDGFLVSFREMIGHLQSMARMTRWEDLLVPVVEIAGWDTVFNLNIEFDSAYTPGDHVGPNIVEGVVIQPYDAVYVNAGSHTFMVKQKNEAFKEKQKVKKPPAPEDTEVARLNAEFTSYLTDARLQAVFSKEGEITESAQIGQYIRLMLEDAKEDFLKDFGEEAEQLTNAQRKKVYNVGATIANMLKTYL